MIYRRRFDPDGADSLAKLSRWVRPGSAVLELGAAVGYFTEHLHAQGCTVDIVELDAEAAHEAARHARCSVVADLSGDGWIAELGDKRYDTIVCADVLEHLSDGARLLKRVRPLLAGDGELLLSVPNIAHSAVIANLCDERFDYAGEGLLDTTHLRLYTWRSLVRLLEDCGYAVRDWDATEVELFDTEFRVRSESLAAPLRELLVQRPNAMVYQWLVRASPGSVHEHARPRDVRTREHVPVRLLHGATAGALSLEQAVTAKLPIGDGAAALEWRFPGGSSALRLLLADRIGIMRILDLRLYAGDGVIWSYEGDATRLEASPATIALGDRSSFALVAQDAWVVPVIDGAAADRADRMTASLAWPGAMSEAADYNLFAAMATAMARQGATAAHARDELVDALRLRERQRDDAREALAALQATLTQTVTTLNQRNADIASLEEAVEGYRAENARLDAALTAQERIIGYRQSLRWWLKLPVVRVKLWWHRLRGAGP